MTRLIIFTIFCLTACQSKEEKQSVNSSNSSYSSEDRDNNSDNDGCGFPDDTYSATVDYENPETGFTNTYTLDVVVRDCDVIEIDFPKGGWLDGHHLEPGELDENGETSITDDRDRIWEIHIESASENKIKPHHNF